MTPNTPQNLPLLINIRDGASLIGLSRSSIYRLISRGSLEIVRIGGRALLRRSDLEALAQAGEVRQ